MRRLSSAMLAGSSLLVLVTTLGAHAKTTPSAATATTTDSTEEIIVTARRKAENLQDVPETVSAVSSEQLQKLNILTVQDITEVVSGLQITVGGLAATESVRGVTSNQASQVPALTLAHYVNDAPVQNTITFFEDIYDVGQIEVLKGPQGTARGIAAPSGAITLTTRRPDLDRIGGYADVTETTLNAHNIQGAVSFPIVPDKLAIRIAGLEDSNKGNDVRSVNSRILPYETTQSGRVSLRFEPTDNIAANVMFEHLNRYDQTPGSGVFGTGSPGGPDAPANYNGPPIGPYDRLTATTVVPTAKNVINLLTGQFDWTIAGQKLSYVGSYSYFDQKLHGQDGTGNSSEVNTLPNVVTKYFDDTPQHVNTHELRLQSVDRIAGMFDYVVGGYHSYTKTGVVVDNGPGNVLPGFFGAPGSTPSPYVANSRFAQDIYVLVPSSTKETSFFGNLTAHIADKWEFSAGTRHISETSSAPPASISFLSGFAAEPLSGTACAAAGGQYQATYAGFCDVPVPGVAFPSGPTVVTTSHTWIWDASASYHIDPDLMVYVHAGSSFLPGGNVAAGITNATNDPVLNNLENLKPETSKSYEGGAKWSFLDRRAHLNVDYYHQIYDNFFYSSPIGVYYNTGVGGPNTVSNHDFSSNVPAKVDGFDVDLAMDVTKQWNVQGNFSWSHGRLSGNVPCNSIGFTGVPDNLVPPSNGSTFIAAGKSIAFCPSNASTSTAPRWNFNIQSEYDLSVTEQADAFIRGLFFYQPSNPNTSMTYVVPAYGTLNLYIGVRDPGHHWELSLFGKNITNTVKILSLGANPTQPFLAGFTQPFFGPSGYTSVALTPPRVFGINARYNFGAG